MRVRPPWWVAAIGILALAGLCSSYHLRVVSTGQGLGLGLGSGPGRPAAGGLQTYMALSGDLIVEIRQLPVWARGRRLLVQVLEHSANAAGDNGSAAQEYTVQGSRSVNVPTNAAATSANTGGRLQWVRGYNRSAGAAAAARPLGKMTSSQPNRQPASPLPGVPAVPTTLKPIVVRFPCGFVSRGGRYALRLAGLDRTKKTTSRKDQAGGGGSGEASSGENDSGEPPPSNRVPAGAPLKPVTTTTTTTTTTSTTTASSTTASSSTGNATTARPAFNDPALPATNETGGLFLLDVLWPRARLSLGPKEIVTYPEEAVRATVEFLGVRCPSAKDSPVSESWLELVYCGPVLSDCTYTNYTQRQILHSEQVLGYPHQLSLGLQCELFGMAGYYSLHLRAGRPSLVEWPVDAGANATIKAVWSDRFVFNVHARSIFPCAAHSGVSALFTYPGCVLPAGDRVRLFARLRADVSTLLPPLTLQYVAEQRVAKGTHAVNFDCDLFSERYVEYCFVYVSQAITGAVTDVRMDCVPTLPVSDADSGSWGAWSPWSACTSTCGGGTRNRYRFCDSPPPRYGAKFCEGSSLETQRCGPDNEWDCAPEGASADLPLPPPPPGGSNGVAGHGAAAVGSGCRCGCVVHLGTTKPGTLLASSSKSCPGRSFWLVQADANHVVRLWVQQQRLSCGAQWLRVRDGDSLAGRLLLSLDSDSAGAAVGPHHHAAATEAVSSSNTMLVEFYSDEAVAALEECAAGFLAHAQQAVPPNETLVGYPLAVAGAGVGVGAGLLDDAWSFGGALRLTVVHAAAVAFLGGVVLLSTCLCAQYGHRYRKYQLTAAKEDQETLSLTDNEETGVLVRAASSATLVSEVVSMKGFKITREQERAATEEESVLGGSADSVTGSASGSVTVSVGSPESAGLSTDSGTAGSRGLGPPLDATASLPNSPQPQTSPQASPGPGMRRSGSCERPAQPQQPRRQRPSSVRIGPAPRPKQGGPVSPVREEDHSTGPTAEAGAAQGGTAADLAAQGRGPAGPGGAAAKWRPMPRRLARGVASNASSTSTLVNEGGVPGSPASSVRSWSRASCASTASTSTAGSSSSRTATPTNAAGPVALGVGPAGPHRPLPLNPKESKDRRNRERLLRAAGSTGGSEFSLGPDTEMEMDYYDYNVHNACAAPGSLLGMDPAYLMWIPPYTPGSAGSWEEDGEDGPLFDGDVSSSEASDHANLQQQQQGGAAVDEEEGTELQELRSPAAATSPSPLAAPRSRFVQGTHQGEQRAQIHTARVTELTVKEADAKAEPPLPLALQQLTASPRRLAGRQGWQQAPLDADPGDTEKETSVVKSPSDQRLLYRLHQDAEDDDDDIKFADDGDDDDCEDIFSKDSKVDPKTVPLLGKRSDLNA